MFLCLGIFHFCQSTKKIEHIKDEVRVKSIDGVNVGLVEFVRQFNGYIDNLNSNNKTINIVTGFGYLVAAFTALFSYFIS